MTAEFQSDEFDGEGTQYNGSNTKNSHKTERTRGVKRSDLQHDDDGPFAKHQRIVEDIPSTQELIYMKETKALYHNSFFRIQLETLLSEITLKSKHKLALDKWIQNFTDHVLALPNALKAVPLCDWSCYAGVGAPLPWTPRIEGVFQFTAPASVATTGSYADGSLTTLNKVVDLKIVVPESCLESGDHRDGRWLLKRAHYLVHIASALMSCPLVDALHWGRHLDEPLRPALLVNPKLRGGAGKWQVRLLPVPAAGAFKVHAFSPQKLNLKYKGEVSCAQLNFLCGVDTALSDNCSVLEDTLPAMPGLLQAVKLAKVWLRQRHLSEGRGAVTGHVVSMLVLYLFRLRRVNAQMSAYQVFRVLLNYLEHECEWQTKGVSLYELSKNSGAPNPYVNTILPVTAHHTHYSVVFVDPSGYLNITTTLSPHTLLRMKQEAKLSLAVLSSNSPESFESLFIQRTDFHLTFDQSLVVRLSCESLEQYYSLPSTPSARLLVNQLHPSVFPDQSSGDEPAAVGEMYPVVEDMCELLKKGLGDRAFLVAPQLAVCEAWGVDQPTPPDTESVFIGLRLNPISAFSLLIKVLFILFSGPDNKESCCMYLIISFCV
ncbi:Nrap protein domain 2 [Trinorchestia longiramus]|nr:Nrap protein domain 2 [Trinorchestia longiramus]